MRHNDKLLNIFDNKLKIILIRMMIRMAEDDKSLNIFDRPYYLGMCAYFQNALLLYSLPSTKFELIFKPPLRCTIRMKFLKLINHRDKRYWFPRTEAGRKWRINYLKNQLKTMQK